MATVVVVDLALWYCRRADVGTGRICALSVVTSKRVVTGASESWCIIPGPGFAHLAPSPSPSSSPHPSYDQRFLLVSTKRLHIFHGVVAITSLARASRCRRITFYFSEHHGNDAVTSRHSPISLYRYVHGCSVDVYVLSIQIGVCHPSSSPGAVLVRKFFVTIFYPTHGIRTYRRPHLGTLWKSRVLRKHLECSPDVSHLSYA
ncbi:hypothetical protein IG631_01246 [Alternaria alternata]|nr:hypothetical protein IG631_01246 [Alternaria alternata]